MAKTHTRSIRAIRSAPLSHPAEPVLGWRLWRVRGDRLRSWSAEHTWEAGENVAHCLGGLSTPHQSPGRWCMCGFWALFSPLRAIELGRFDRVEDASALGLVRGWGEVAVHGREGFRAERAGIACIFSDWVWDAPRLPPPEGPLKSALWRVRATLGWSPRAIQPHPERRTSLHRVAGTYGVPVVSLGGALRCGLLAELGATDGMTREVAAWLTQLKDSDEIGQAPGLTA